MKRRTKEQIKNKIKDYLKLFLLIGFITSLWILGCVFTNLI